MKKVSTTAKGDAFEERVFNIVQHLLQLEKLPINCKHSNIYCKKKYTSIESKKDIIFDLAIETFMPNSNEIANLTLIECKDYASPIEVSKIRDFIYRMNEVRANKGYFFTTSYFQNGAINLAIANHVGLVIVGNTNELQWKTRRIHIRDKKEVENDVFNIIRGLQPKINYSFAAIGKSYYSNLFEFLISDVGLHLQPLKIPYRDNEQIIEIINNELGDYNIISNLELLKFISKREYHIEQSVLPNNILGEVDFESKKITISNTLYEGSPRWRFTIAHELGHIILHSEQIKESNIKAIDDYFDDEMSNINISDKTISRMEIQANSFAAILLAPSSSLDIAYKTLFIKEGIRNFPILTIDNQPCNINLANRMLSTLSSYFNVSKEVVKKRLLDLGYLQDETGLKHIELNLNNR